MTALRASGEPVRGRVGQEATSLTVYRENARRHGDWICHLFRDCRQLVGRAYEEVRLPLNDSFIPLCKQCRIGPPE